MTDVRREEAELRQERSGQTVTDSIGAVIAGTCKRIIIIIRRFEKSRSPLGSRQFEKVEI